MDLILIRCCGHFLINAEGGAKNYKRDHSTVTLTILYCLFGAAQGLNKSCALIKKHHNNLINVFSSAMLEYVRFKHVAHNSTCSYVEDKLIKLSCQVSNFYKVDLIMNLEKSAKTCLKYFICMQQLSLQ